jgi:hypothetical protein
VIAFVRYRVDVPIRFTRKKVKITLERTAFASIADASVIDLREVVFDFDEDANIIDCFGISDRPVNGAKLFRAGPTLAALSRMAQIRFKKRLLNLARQQSASAVVVPFPGRP